jgi:negative regulator of sigma E activity
MNDALKMQISAFVDGELPENESELLLRRLSQDHALRQQVAQYLEIGRLIRRDHEVPGMSGLRDRIAAALGEEPVRQPTATSVPVSKFTKPAVGLAIAASVTMLALLGARQVYSPGEDGNSSDNFAGRTVPSSQISAEPADDELLRQFYLHHNPRLVTWQLRDGSLVEIGSEEDGLDADEAKSDAEIRH